MKLFDRNILSVTLLAAICLAASAHGQSTNQSFPTPITNTEISGTIKPRDVGDSRLTSYYYQFDGSQGDLFINVVTRNFTGDIDVFTQTGLRPIAKIVVYADFGENETGRVIYLRKPEKMILRVQGRTPGDEAAMFRIKFAGSFVASTQAEPEGEPALPSLTARNESGIRVNSVGTIVAVAPKPTPADTETVARTDERTPAPTETEKENTASVTETKTDERAEAPGDDPKKVSVVVTENIPAATPPTSRRRSRRGVPPRRTSAAAPDAPNSAAETPPATPPARTRRGRAAAARPATVKEPDPLEKVNLVILFKDGTTIQRPMSEVLRFTVDKGVLTVISKDGSIGRYSILDVSRVTIE
jgi:hypothetical protein